MVLSLVLVVLLAISVVSNLSQAFFGFGTGTRHAHLDGRWLEEFVMENNHVPEKIAVVHVQGLITGEAINWEGHSMVDFIEDQLNVAAKDDDVRAVILKVDSPGGEVLASDDIYRAIAEFQREHGKPVVASMGSLAASGGYYVAAPCQWIVANELTITGSIGVIMQSYNFRGLLNKVGVRPETFKSGRFKDMLNPAREPAEIPDEERRMLQALIDETFDKFKAVVGAGRQAAADKNKGKGRRLADRWEEYADGRVMSGKQAFDLGFVDELGNFDTAVQRARVLAGVRTANLVSYRMPVRFGDLFRLFGRSEGKSIKLDLGLDGPRLQAGRPYFLSSSLIH
jgi:protease-4